MPRRPPDIVDVHSHDTGRYVEPYGFPVSTPNLQQLANQGVLFRQAFCAAATCSGSRACLLTGQYSHSNGMLGPAHPRVPLRDYREHVANTLRHAGYWSALFGEQHVSKRPDVIGYDHVVKVETTHVGSRTPTTGPARTCCCATAGRAVGSPPSSSRTSSSTRRSRRTLPRTLTMPMYAACSPSSSSAGCARPMTRSSPGRSRRPQGAEINLPDQVSPWEPTMTVD